MVQSEGPGAGGFRPGDHLGAAGRRRGAGLALSGRGDRRGARPSRGAADRVPAARRVRRAVRRPDASADYVRIDRLSQWLSYSLIEPLEAAGVTVVDVEGLTGLAEYRNGGLFVDSGVLVLNDPADAGRAHPVDGPLVVGWRSL